MNGPLLIDYREPHSIKEALKDISTVLELPEGDYGVFAGKDLYLVERKAISDFLNSFKSGQLMTQLRATRRRTPHAILLLEGWFAPTKRDDGKATKHSGGTSALPYYGILNFLLEIQVFLGIMVIQTTSLWGTMNWLRAFYHWVLKPEHKAISRIMLPQVPENIWDPEGAEQLRLLMCLPGIGRSTAENIVAEFPTLIEFLTAEPERVEAVKGLGAKTRKKIWAFTGRSELPKIKKRMKPEDRIAMLKDLLEGLPEMHPDEKTERIEQLMQRPVWMHEIAFPALLYEEIRSKKRGEITLSEIAQTLVLKATETNQPE